MLNILEGFDIAAMGHNSADYLHVVSRGQEDRLRRSRRLPGRPRVRAAVSCWRRCCRRSTRRGAARTSTWPGPAPIAPARWTPRRPSAAEFAGRDRGDTIYLAAADGQGNVVSFIQSLFGSFGAGIVAGDTGITLHNRGSGFTLAPGHPNEVGPRKRPLHTLVPAMIVKDGRPWVAFGVMGGDNQAQAHAQVVTKLVDFGLHVQAAGDAARVRHTGEALAVESGIGDDVRARARPGAATRSPTAAAQMGGYQAVCVDPASGVLLGGSDPRKDGLAIGW